MRRSPGPGGKIMFAEMKVGDSRLYLNDEFPEMGGHSPLSLNGTPVTIHVFVEDADEAFNRAVQAGATVKFPLADQFWGDRYGIVSDPYRHQWSIGAHIRDVTAEEMQKAMAAFAGGKHP